MDVVRRKSTEKWKTNRWLLFQDNAPAHRPVSFKDFLAENSVTALKFLPTLI
jgi:hypothetical protein